MAFNGGSGGGAAAALVAVGENWCDHFVRVKMLVSIRLEHQISLARKIPSYLL
jgi:hypothetical protein